MMMLLRTVMTIIAYICPLAGLVLLIYGTATKRKKFCGFGIAALLMCPLLLGLQFILAVKQYSFDMNDLPTFSVTSSSLSSGVWDDSISNTDIGSNTSPELSWEEVPGAEVYLVYMIDPDGFNWVHMNTVTSSTSLPAGAVTSEYVGPYPPSGTHEYVVYVFALRSAKDGYPGDVDHMSDGISSLGSMVNTFENGESGNVIAYGTVSGTFSHVE